MPKAPNKPIPEWENTDKVRLHLMIRNGILRYRTSFIENKITLCSRLFYTKEDALVELNRLTQF